MATTGVLSQDEHLLLLRSFRDLPDALLFESILDSAEIECFLADENTIRMDWFWSNALGGIKLCVRATDAGTASSLLAQPVLERFDVEGIGEYEQPRCANCNSLEVSFQGLNKAVDYVRALLGGPRPLHRSLCQCDSCGHQWPESGEKPPANLLIAASSCLLILLAAQTFLGWLLWLILPCPAHSAKPQHLTNPKSAHSGTAGGRSGGRSERQIRLPHPVVFRVRVFLAS